MTKTFPLLLLVLLIPGPAQWVSADSAAAGNYPHTGDNTSAFLSLADSTGSGGDPSGGGAVATAVSAGFTTNGTDPFRVTEGGSNSYTLVLDTQPSEGVTIAITRRPLGSTDLTVMPASLTFSTSNWNTPQTVTISAAEDDDLLNEVAEFNHAFTSGDSAYGALEDSALLVLLFDNDGSIADQVYSAGVLVNVTLPAIGFAGTPRFALQPALPAGLSFNAVTRVLSGVPAAATEAAAYTYTAAGIDNDSPRSFTLTVVPYIVSNLAEAPGNRISNNAGNRYAMPFTTGDNPRGYILRNVVFDLAGSNNTTGYIYRYDGAASGDGKIGASLASLTGPAPSGLGHYAYTPGRTVTLTPNTIYWVGINNQSIGTTQSDGERAFDSWEINNTDPIRSSDVTPWQSAGAPGLRFGVTVTPIFSSSLTFRAPVTADQIYLHNTPIQPLVLPEAIGGTGRKNYTLSPDLPSGLKFTASARTISGTPLRNFEASTYVYTATDVRGISASLTFTLTVRPVQFDSPGPDAAAFYLNERNSLALPQALSARAVSYTLTPIPAGLTFAAAAGSPPHLFGTPTAAAAMRLTYTARIGAGSGETISREFDLTITDGSGRLRFPSAVGVGHAPDRPEVVLTVAAGQSVALTLPAALGGSGARVYSLDGPWAALGLRFAPNTRVLSGASTVYSWRLPDGYFGFRYRVRDAAGSSAQTGVIFTVVLSGIGTEYRPLMFASELPQTIRWPQGTEFSHPLPQAVGGVGTLSYTMRGLAAASGLQFTTAGGSNSLSGIVNTAGDYELIYQVMDETRQEPLQPRVSVVVAAGPAFRGRVSDQVWLKDAQVSLTLPEAVGSSVPLAYTLTPVPSGMLFDAANRVLSGAPDTAGVMAVTYNVHGADGVGGNRQVFRVTVKPLQFDGGIKDPRDPDGPSVTGIPFVAGTPITPLTLPAATVVGGGTASYSLTPVPSGLRFNAATRLLWGTPGTTGVIEGIELTYTAATAEGSDTLKFVVTVIPPVGFVHGVAPQRYVLHHPIQSLQLPEARFGDGAFSYRLTPALNSGLVFDLDSRTLSGTPTKLTRGNAALNRLFWTVTDGSGKTATIRFGVQIFEPVSFADGTSIADQSYRHGVAIEPLTLPAAQGGAPPFGVDHPCIIGVGSLLDCSERGTLPVTYDYLDFGSAARLGLNFNPANRVISGTPRAVAGVYQMYYAATEPAGSVSSLLEFKITIPRSPLAFSVQTIEDQTYLINKHRHFDLPSAIYGQGAYNYKLTPWLPIGLRFLKPGVDPGVLTPYISGAPVLIHPPTEYTYTVSDATTETSLIFKISVIPEAVKMRLRVFLEGPLE